MTDRDALAGPVRCCLCGDEAVAVFSLPGGCVARPDLTEQPLCLHHAVRSQPRDGIVLERDLTMDGNFRGWWESRTQ